MKTATTLIIILTFGWAWAELRCKYANDEWVKCEQEANANEQKYEDAKYKALAYDSAQAKDDRMQSHIKATIDEATKRHK